jgi:hypothetical protein
MKNALILATFTFVFIYACSSSKTTSSKNINVADTAISVTDTIRIANDALEYEIIILEQGFDRFLNTQPPQEYYGIGFLESKNYLYSQEYNRRVRDITRSRGLYPQEINYDSKLKYGKEVNFLLYNYFRFFEIKYNQKLK